MEHPRYVIITNIWGKKPETYHKFVWEVEKSKHYPDYIEKEIHYFNTLDELKEFVSLFEEYCSTLKLPSNIKDNLKKDKYWARWNEGERLWGYLWGDRETRKLTWGGYKLKEYNPGSDKRLLLDKLFRTTDDVPNGYKWDDGEYEGWLQFKWGDGKNAVDYVAPKKKKKIEDIAEDHSEQYEKLYELMDKRAKWIEEHPDLYNEYLDKLVDKYEDYEDADDEDKFIELENLNSLISQLESEMLAEEDDDYIDEEYERQSEFAEALEDAFAKAEDKERIKLLGDRW